MSDEKIEAGSEWQSKFDATTVIVIVTRLIASNGIPTASFLYRDSKKSRREFPIQHEALLRNWTPVPATPGESPR